MATRRRSENDVPKPPSADRRKAHVRAAPAATPVVRVLLGGVIAMGPGKAALLEAIESNGSISAAARSLGMSYRRAWQLVDAMNHCFVEPMVKAATGGEGGGGAVVTPFGHAVLAKYRAMEVTAVAAIAHDLDEFRPWLKPRADA